MLNRSMEQALLWKTFLSYYNYWITLLPFRVLAGMVSYDMGSPFNITAPISHFPQPRRTTAAEPALRLPATLSHRLLQGSKERESHPGSV